MGENLGVIECSEFLDFFRIVWKLEPMPCHLVVDKRRLDNLVEIALAQSPPFSLSDHASFLKLLVPNSSKKCNYYLNFELKVLSKSVEDCRKIYFKLIIRLVSSEKGLNWNPFGFFVTRLRILDADRVDMTNVVQKNSTGFLPAIVLEFELPGHSCRIVNHIKSLILELTFQTMDSSTQLPRRKTTPSVHPEIISISSQTPRHEKMPSQQFEEVSPSSLAGQKRRSGESASGESFSSFRSQSVARTRGSSESNSGDSFRFLSNAKIRRRNSGFTSLETLPFLSDSRTRGSSESTSGDSDPFLSDAKIRRNSESTSSESISDAQTRRSPIVSSENVSPSSQTSRHEEDPSDLSEKMPQSMDKSY